MSLLLVDEPSLLPVRARRSWEGAARPRRTPEPSTGPRRTPAPASSVHVPAPRTETPLPVEPVVLAPPADAPVRQTAGQRLGDLLLTLAALLGLVVMGITVTAHVTGLRPLVVESGSMEPTIPTGGMVLVRTVPASQIEVDDVVAVVRPDRTRVTHRVLAVVHRGPTAELTLKGDANEDPDPLPVTVTEAGELVLSVPAVGRVPAFLASAEGGFVLGCLVTAFARPALRRRAA